MSMTKRMLESLDRHITGNYGEDQFERCKPLSCRKGYIAYEVVAVEHIDVFMNKKEAEEHARYLGEKLWKRYLKTNQGATYCEVRKVEL